jgi:hypothetical protein
LQQKREAFLPRHEMAKPFRTTMLGRSSACFARRRRAVGPFQSHPWWSFGKQSSKSILFASAE